jgi:hypothetical protein
MELAWDWDGTGLGIWVLPMESIVVMERFILALGLSDYHLNDYAYFPFIHTIIFCKN